MPDKYVAAEQQSRLGKPKDATHGVKVLLGLSTTELSGILANPVGAIEADFAQKGSAEDKTNLHCVLHGNSQPGWWNGDLPSGAPRPHFPSLAELVEHPHAKMAKLERQHVLALRLYTTSSYSKVNDPLRSDPVKRPHPFAATTFFISEGIKMLRAVEAQMPDAYTARIYRRGMKDQGITGEFMTKGRIRKQIKENHATGH